MNKNFEKIVDCLIESYTKQIEKTIKQLAEDKAAEIIEENYLLQTVNYSGITYDPEIDADESTELSETEFEIGGKLDWAELATLCHIEDGIDELKESEIE